MPSLSKLFKPSAGSSQTTTRQPNIASSPTTKRRDSFSSTASTLRPTTDVQSIKATQKPSQTFKPDWAALDNYGVGMAGGNRLV